jgi:hypothetical protein
VFYGDATGPFRARTLARAPAASMPFHCRAGGLPPEHAPLAHVRTTSVPALQDLLVHRLLDAPEMGGLTWGNLSLDGTTIQAAASQSSALSCQRLRARDSPRRPEGDTVCARTEQAEPAERPAGGGSAAALAFRHARLATWAQAQAV